PHRRFRTLPLSSMGLPLRGQGFTSGSQARRVRQAESSSSSCGLVSHLRLLPTPPLGDAVTFGYRPESVCLKRTCTSLNVCARGRTDRWRPAGPLTPLLFEGADGETPLPSGETSQTSGYTRLPVREASRAS